MASARHAIFRMPCIQFSTWSGVAGKGGVAGSSDVTVQCCGTVQRFRHQCPRDAVSSTTSSTMRSLRLLLHAVLLMVLSCCAAETILPGTQPSPSHAPLVIHQLRLLLCAVVTNRPQISRQHIFRASWMAQWRLHCVAQCHHIRSACWCHFWHVETSVGGMLICHMTFQVRVTSACHLCSHQLHLLMPAHWNVPGANQARGRRPATNAQLLFWKYVEGPCIAAQCSRHYSRALTVQGCNRWGKKLACIMHRCAYLSVQFAYHLSMIMHWPSTFYTRCVIVYS